MDYYEVLEELVLIEGLSGYEGKVAEVMKKRLESLVDEVYSDKAGNVIAKIEGIDSKAPTVMVGAHMDSLGFVVRRIDDNGFIQFDRLGGIPEKVLPALQVRVGTIQGGSIPGIIAVKAHHITPPEEKMKVDDFRSLYIDVGAKSREEVRAAGVHVGCPVVYKPSFTRLMNDRVSGTWFDDRAGCAALIGIAEELHEARPNATTYLVASVWEEFNLRGAMLAARKIKPDACIYIDCGLDGFTPEMRGTFNNVTMDGGPAVCLYNFHGRGTLNGCIAHKGLYDLALRCSTEKGLSLQETASLGGLTDTAYIQFENDYIACLDIAFPMRYAHSPIETTSMNAIEQTAHFIVEMVGMLDSSFRPERF